MDLQVPYASLDLRVHSQPCPSLLRVCLLLPFSLSSSKAAKEKIRRGLVASMVLSYPREKADSQPDPEGPLYETMQEMQGTEPVERVFYKFPRV